MNGRIRGILDPVAAGGAAVLLAGGQAMLTRAQLAGAPTRAPIGLNPLGTASGAAVLLITCAIYFWLGRRVARGGGSTNRAIVVGIFTGLAAGALGGLAQAYGVRDYLDLAVSRVYVPAWFLSAILGLFAALVTILGGLVGGTAAWFGARAATRGGAATTR